MNKQIRMILLISIPSTILIAMIMNFTLSISSETERYQKLTSDLVTIELIVRAKQLDEIPVKTYFDYVDSVTLAASRKRTYSPFDRRPDLRPKVSIKRTASEHDFIHVVTSGESLSLIADMYRVPLSLVTSINGIYDSHQIMVGQKLTIPGSATVGKRRAALRRPTGITVNGIIWDELEPNAVINGDVYQVGDIFKGYTIFSMTDSSVEFVSEVDTFSTNFKRE